MEKKLLLDYLLRPHWPRLAIAFDELLARGGLYAHLYEIQFSDKAAAGARCG